MPTTSELRAPILNAAHRLLKPIGYRKSASVFSRKSEDVIHLIEIQGSSYNSASECRFTVNVAVFAPAAVPADVREFRKPSVPAAHWRERIGFLGAAQVDQWWTVHGLVGAAEAAAEISAQLSEVALPALSSIPNFTALVSIWLSGSSPGVPDKLRREYLERLGLSAGSSDVAVQPVVPPDVLPQASVRR